MMRFKSLLLCTALLCISYMSAISQVTVQIPDCANCPTSSTALNSYSVGEVCPLMLGIKDFINRPANTPQNDNVIWVTSNGEIWGFGSNVGRSMGYPDPYGVDADGITVETPAALRIESPSPLAAIYRTGIDKVWKSLTTAYPDHRFGSYALTEDNELWTWGGLSNSTITGKNWDEAASQPPAGQRPWNAWQVPAPTGVSGITQVFPAIQNLVFARGTDGYLYAMGTYDQNRLGNDHTGTAYSSRVPLLTRSNNIPHKILDNKYAFLSNVTANIYITEDGETYLYIGGGLPTNPHIPPSQIPFPTAGTKAVKLTGSYPIGGSRLGALDENGKIYYMLSDSNNSHGYPNATGIESLNLVITSPGALTGWNAFDPEGSGGTYRDVCFGGTHGYAVTSTGKVLRFRLTGSAAVYDLGLEDYDIVSIYSDSTGECFMTSSDGRTFVYSFGTREISHRGISFFPLTLGQGPYLMNCYLNPTGPNFPTGN